jgi:hypothetical protein
MATPVPNNKSKHSPADLDVPYTIGDKIPAPEAVEGGESVWAIWSEVNKQHENRFADTAPASAPMKLTANAENPGWAPTQSMKPSAPSPRRREAQPLFTLDAAMLVARRNNRVCPRPERWQELFSLLPARKTLRGPQTPPPPPLGPAWAVTPPLTKRLCFREHVEWAERQGVLEALMGFMQTMPEDDWLHMGED